MQTSRVLLGAAVWVGRRTCKRICDHESFSVANFTALQILLIDACAHVSSIPYCRRYGYEVPQEGDEVLEEVEEEEEDEEVVEAAAEEREEGEVAPEDKAEEGEVDGGRNEDAAPAKVRC